MQGGGGIGWGAESGSVLAAHTEIALVSVSRVCLHVVCASVPSLHAVSLKCSVAAGSVASRRGRGEQAFETPSCKLQTRLQTRPPREAAGEGARGRPGTGGPGCGALALVAGRFWGQSRGYGKQRVRIFSGVDGRGESEKKRISTAPTLLYACLCSVSSSAGRPCSPGGGGGDGKAEETRGSSAQTISPPLVPGKDDFQKCELCV